MKLAIMQPYFFPYLGYWQLINAVDKFVIYDDVNFIKKGFINRNNILLNNNSYLFTIPLEKVSQNKLIKDINLIFDKKSKKNFLKTIMLAYQKAPMYSQIFPLLEKIIMEETNDLTEYINFSITEIDKFLDIKTKLYLSSNINKDNTLHGKNKIIDICKNLQATQYINAIGGQKLYSKEDFLKNGIQLNFIKMNDIKYKQFNDKFVPNLSIIDIMMFNSKDKIKEMLNNYTLI